MYQIEPWSFCRRLQQVHTTRSTVRSAQEEQLFHIRRRTAQATLNHDQDASDLVGLLRRLQQVKRKACQTCILGEYESERGSHCRRLLGPFGK